MRERRQHLLHNPSILLPQRVKEDEGKERRVSRLPQLVPRDRPEK
jgi:hypothetical protein